jgi:hypothetical protein
MVEKESCRVVYFEHPAGITCGCAKCRTVLSQGTWAVGVIVSEKYKYIVGCNPPPECCGEVKTLVIDACATESEALALSDRVTEQLNREGTTANLNLLEMHQSISDSIQ